MKISVRELQSQAEKLQNEIVLIQGWIRTNRDQKEFGFINLNDGSTVNNVQIVYDKTLDNFDLVSKYRVGCALNVYGKVVLTPNSKQAFELHATKISLEGDCPENYPIQPKRHTREFLREQAHLRARTNLFNAVFRTRSLLAFAIHEFFQKQGFVYVNTPIITASDCEGAGEMFRVTTLDLEKLPKDKPIDYSKDFFGKSANLTVSGQLEGETFAQAFKKIYTFGPTFRAENSNTQRHASEFWMIEPEIAFADLYDDMNLIENMLKYVIKYILENGKDEMNFFENFVRDLGGLFERLADHHLGEGGGGGDGARAAEGLELGVGDAPVGAELELEGEGVAAGERTDGRGAVGLVDGADVPRVAEVVHHLFGIVPLGV